MLSTRKLSSHEILGSSSRLPFSSRDRKALLFHLRHAGRNGLDLSLKAERPAEGLEKMIESGVLHFQSAVLHADFMLINFHCGTSPLGLVKSRIFVFYSDSGDEWIPVISNSRLRPILRMITNMYGYAGKEAALPAGRSPDAPSTEIGLPSECPDLANLTRQETPERLPG